MHAIITLEHGITGYRWRRTVVFSSGTSYENTKNNILNQRDKDNQRNVFHRSVSQFLCAVTNGLKAEAVDPPDLQNLASGQATSPEEDIFAALKSQPRTNIWGKRFITIALSTDSVLPARSVAGPSGKSGHALHTKLKSAAVDCPNMPKPSPPRNHGNPYGCKATI